VGKTESASPGEFTKAVIQGAGGLPVAARIAGDDLVPGSNTNDDAVRFAEELEKWGIDMLNVTGGWHESKVPQVTGRSAGRRLQLPGGGSERRRRDTGSSQQTASAIPHSRKTAWRWKRQTW